jgi:hypothetical protein
MNIPQLFGPLILIGFGADAVAFRGGRNLVHHFVRDLYHYSFSIVVLAFRAILVATSLQLIFYLVKFPIDVWHAAIENPAWTLFACYISIRMLWNAVILILFDGYIGIRNAFAAFKEITSSTSSPNDSVRNAINKYVRPDIKRLDRAQLAYSWIRFSAGFAIVILVLLDPALRNELWISYLLGLT